MHRTSTALPLARTARMPAVWRRSCQRAFTPALNPRSTRRYRSRALLFARVLPAFRANSIRYTIFRGCRQPGGIRPGADLFVGRKWEVEGVPLWLTKAATEAAPRI